MPEQFHITTKGRYCLHGEADIQCLADVSATDVIELRRTQLLQAVALYRALGGGWNTPVRQP